MCQVHGPEYRPPPAPSIKTAEQFEELLKVAKVPRWALVLSLTMDFHRASVPAPEWLK